MHGKKRGDRRQAEQKDAEKMQIW